IFARSPNPSLCSYGHDCSLHRNTLSSSNSNMAITSQSPTTIIESTATFQQYTLNPVLVLLSSFFVTFLKRNFYNFLTNNIDDLFTAIRKCLSFYFLAVSWN